MVRKKYLSNTWIELSETAYAGNLAFFRELVGPRRELSVVVKANGYGHGWQSIARLAARHGADSFCVHSLDEALRLRRAGFTQNVLIMGHVPLARLEEVVEGKFRLVLFNRETLERLAEITEARAALVRVHLKIETGTHRWGVSGDELRWFLDRLKQTPRIMLEAVYTHFANIEDTRNADYADYQKYQFHQQMKLLKEAGFSIFKKHAACTAAVLLFPDTHFDMVRLGIGQYGLWPSAETLASSRSRHGDDVRDRLTPVMTWKTRVSQLKWVAPDNTIGYGRTTRTTRETRLAVLPVGYSDGYPRALSNVGVVLIRGQRAPVRGRICMNVMMVDVTHIAGVTLEDEVVLLGRQGTEVLTPEEVAAAAGTIAYEIVARINPDIPRVLVDMEPDTDAPSDADA